MTKETLQEILHILELDYEAEPTLAYVFYRTSDGRINNFSISIRHGGGELNDEQLQELMHQEYPSTRGTTTIAVERPEKVLPVAEWLDTAEVSQMLHVTPRTLRNWASRGWLRPMKMGGRRIYYKHSDIDAIIEAHAIDEHGRFDSTAMFSQKAARTLEGRQETSGS